MQRERNRKSRLKEKEAAQRREQMEKEIRKSAEEGFSEGKPCPTKGAGQGIAKVTAISAYLYVNKELMSFLSGLETEVAKVDLIFGEPP